MIGVIQCNGRPRVIFYIWCLARRKKQSGWQGFVSPRYCSILFNDFLSFSHYWLNTPILTGHTTASLFSSDGRELDREQDTRISRISILPLIPQYNRQKENSFLFPKLTDSYCAGRIVRRGECWEVNICSGGWLGVSSRWQICRIVSDCDRSSLS